MDVPVLIKKTDGTQHTRTYSFNHLDADALYKNSMRSALYNVLVEEADELLDYAVSIKIQSFEVNNNG
jgi:hypothetical protein